MLEGSDHDTDLGVAARDAQRVVAGALVEAEFRARHEPATAPCSASTTGPDCPKG